MCHRILFKELIKLEAHWRRIHNYFLDLPIISNGSVKFRCIVVGYCN
jgi:hypothetical protein